MKRIEKSSSPVELTQWVKTQGTLNCRYCNLPSNIRTIVKQRLLADQGHICGYTGIRISDTRSHIEHLKPQSRYFQCHEDVDYHNLLAAYPGSNAGQCAYGAHAKANWYHEEHFISPFSPHCEAAFQFDLEGKITAHSAHHIAAQTTIDRLKLADASLTELRKQAIDTLLFEPGISLKQAKDLLEKMYDRNATGQFRPFCFVLKQACEEYIRRKEKAQTRTKTIQSQAKQSKK
ncbi:MAG: TIGR02646 family protein [Pegethrix bostrychoides GSE-TBD4-15B]|jgi:uncharacterized protein (TIGR02646 family)|uniref:TIGR02646 family protein n=1 Tax=Pegethrix bostrychoides GSE-TBD4-15B TaxID=2839662 RepID=A0A951U623_9CYAN|nr:TIGR02646 family protein [Pegethrix bostrychoides GSE-TBD4-15B]